MCHHLQTSKASLSCLNVCVLWQLLSAEIPTQGGEFFNYMLYLMEQAPAMSMSELVELDHKMCMDYACYPAWNWA